MSNLSPLNAQSGSLTARRPRIRKRLRPSLPRLASAISPPGEPEHSDLEAPEPTSSSSGSSTPSTDITPPTLSEDDNQYGSVFQDRAIPDEEKLSAIAAEYGDIVALMEDSEPERMLAESMGSLFK